MKYILACLVTTSLSMNGYLSDTVALWNAHSNNSNNVYMFGHVHEMGPDEKSQTKHIKQLLNERASQAEKQQLNPLHMLFEQPLLYDNQKSSSMLHKIPLYVQKNMNSTPCENIENRHMALAACKILNSPRPSSVIGSFADTVGRIFNINEITFGHVMSSFKTIKKGLISKLAGWDCLNKYDSKFNQADDFLAEVKSTVKFQKNDEQPTVATFASQYRGDRDMLNYSIVQAFSPLLDVHTECRMQEIPDTYDIALLAGRDHVNAIAYSLQTNKGLCEFYRSPRRSVYPFPFPLQNQQLNILQMQPSWYLKSYYYGCDYAKQLCVSLPKLFPSGE